MKVWLVFITFSDDKELVGVFSSEELARQAMEKVTKQDPDATDMIMRSDGVYAGSSGYMWHAELEFDAIRHHHIGRAELDELEEDFVPTWWAGSEKQ